jgi:hypothetical protein
MLCVQDTAASCVLTYSCKCKSLWPEIKESSRCSHISAFKSSSNFTHTHTHTHNNNNNSNQTVRVKETVYPFTALFCTRIPRTGTQACTLCRSLDRHTELHRGLWPERLVHIHRTNHAFTSLSVHYVTNQVKVEFCVNIVVASESKEN